MHIIGTNRQTVKQVSKCSFILPQKQLIMGDKQVELFIILLVVVMI